MTLDFADLYPPEASCRGVPLAPLPAVQRLAVQDVLAQRPQLISALCWQHPQPWQPPVREVANEVLYVVLYGGARLAIDGAEYSVAPGQVLAVPPWHRFQMRFRDPSQARIIMCSLHLQWQDGSGGSLFERLPRQALDLPDPAWIERLTDLARLDAEVLGASGAAVLTTLMLDWLRAGLVLAPISGDPVVTRAVDLMRRDHVGSLSVALVAQQVGMSPSRLRERFQQALGTGPGQVLRNLRLTRSARLLQEGVADVATIAAQCGYRSATHFHAAFKTRFGITPMQWRRGGHALP